jgi:excinuclease UvrABC nuclease subunit
MRPRHRLAALGGDALPASAGVYALWRDDAPVYVGKAKSLSSRLGKAHRGAESR